MLWAIIYMGVPNTLVFDDRSQFRGTLLEICEIYNVEWKMSETQNRSELGIGKKYHKPIRRTFRNFRIDHHKLKRAFLLSIAVCACNDS